MEILIPFKTPTVNHLYGQHGFRKYLKPEAKELREKIKNIIIKNKNYKIFKITDKIAINVKMHEDWYCKNGTISRKDIANREKFLIDSIFEELDIDDRQIFKLTMEKVQDTQEFSIITINAI